MSVLTGTVTAGTSATLLFYAQAEGGTRLTITTHGNSADVYLGSSNVTPSSNGIVMPKSQNLQIDVPFGERLYIAGNGTDTVKWLTFGD
jgi:hypothetical protein